MKLVYTAIIAILLANTGIAQSLNTPTDSPKFTAFHAVKNNHTIILEWEIATDVPVTHFEIEKLVNGEWKQAGILFSGENNEKAFFFSEKASAEKVSYRIRIGYANGFSSYSDIKNLN